MKSISLCIGALTFLSVGAVTADAVPDRLWWERGADKWYYKDDWKGLALTGGEVYTKAVHVPDGAVSGWIVVWGDRGYKLTVNGQLVGSSVDGALIDDYDISAFLGANVKAVAIRIEGKEVCAEGELVGADGKRYPFATGDDWQKEDGRKPEAKRKTVEPSTGAYHRAHNGRLMTYNDEERGKTSIAKCLARIQKLNEQGIFLMRRLRPAEEIVSFDPDSPWRMAEAKAAPLADKAHSIITAKSIPAQKSGKFADAIAAANEAASLISAAEAPIDAAISLYRAEREITHLENWAAMIGNARAAALPQAGMSVPPGTPQAGMSVPPDTPQTGMSVPPGTPQAGMSVPPGTPQAGMPMLPSAPQTGMPVLPPRMEHRAGLKSVPASSIMAEDLSELKRLSVSARNAYALGDWASSQKAVKRIGDLAQGIKTRLEALGTEAFGQMGGTGIPACGLGSLDEFPEDRFGWLNARELMGNDPANWQFSCSPSSRKYIDLSGKWYFRVDLDNVGERDGWHRNPVTRNASPVTGSGWREIFAPKPWERQGVQEGNLKSPGDAPYELRDARCGDKPYNGFAWYKKSVFVPGWWQGEKLMLSIGNVQNWGRIFINGESMGEGKQNPPARQEIPAELIHFGEENVIAIQVYNHDNFGGIVSGQLAIYVDEADRRKLKLATPPEFRETPGPLSYVKEYTYATEGGPVRYTSLASAMSPAVVVATDGKMLQLWGWEAKGYRPPSAVRYMAEQEPQMATLEDQGTVYGEMLSESWILLQGSDGDVLIVLERRPQSITWEEGDPGARWLGIAYESGPVRAVILTAPAGEMGDESTCRFWARALRRYPVSASECVRLDERRANGIEHREGRRSVICHIRYNYLDLESFDEAEPLTVAPVPMLASYALKYEHPGVQIEKARPTTYRSEYAPYLVLENSDILEYRAPAVDRSKVMKGVGELFGKREAEQNMRGGVSEDEMFRRMAEWGFDHCRYAWAFHADWDLPLVEFVGGPVIENNEAMWKRLDEFVDKCNAAGMQMMLCWFFNEDRPQSDVGGAVRNSTRYWRARPEAKKNAFELWRRIAARYADRPEWAISYDFFNEPAYMNADHWKEIMKELTAIIRSVDKKHTIVWESGDGWAQPQWCLWMEPVDDANVLYSFHHYGKHWGYAYDEYYPSYQNTTERSHIGPWLEAILFSIRYNVPIHCGEFGISTDVHPNGFGVK